MRFLPLISYWEVVTCILIFCGYCFWSAWFARVICPLMQEHSLRLKKLISQVPQDAMLKIRRPVYKRLFKSNRVLRADQKSDVNQTCQQSVFSPMGACIRIWCTSGAVERRSQMFVYRLSHFPFSLLANFFTLSPNREPLHRLSQTRSTYSNIVHDFLPMLFLVFLLTTRKCRKGRSTNSIAQNHWLLSNKGILKWSKKYESLWANLSLHATQPFFKGRCVTTLKTAV